MGCLATHDLPPLGLSTLHSSIPGASHTSLLYDVCFPCRLLVFQMEQAVVMTTVVCGARWHALVVAGQAGQRGSCSGPPAWQDDECDRDRLEPRFAAGRGDAAAFQAGSGGTRLDKRPSRRPRWRPRWICTAKFERLAACSFGFDIFCLFLIYEAGCIEAFGSSLRAGWLPH